MRVVITGALGHIGSALIRAIVPSEFEEIVLLDNLSTQRYCSLFDLPSAVPFRFVEGDVLTADLAALLDGVDAVVHLAAITDATSSFENQVLVEQVNLRGTELVARACARRGAALLFLSTTSVYGVSQGVVDEACPEEEIRPQSPYAMSKRNAEKLLSALGEEMGLRYVTCRFGTIYGTSPGMRFHTAINKFVWQACMGLPLTVWRTALDQERPYLDLSDAIRAIRFFLSPARSDRQIYNVLTDNATVRQIIEHVKAFVPDAKVELVDSQIMNQLSYTVSNKKIGRLGFEFEGNLRSAIQQSVSLLRNARAGQTSSIA